MDVNLIRQDFPILSREVNGKPLVYLDNAATSQKPRQVIEAIANYYAEHNANVHRGIHTLGDESTRMYQEAREEVAGFIGAKDPNELVFVRNTTEAVNLVAFSWGLKNLSEGDEILVTELEHHSNLVPWQRLAHQTGARLVLVPVEENGGLALDYLETLVGSRTKLVALTQVSNVLGSVIDVRRVVKELKRAGSGAKILVDGAQSVPHRKVDVDEMDIDFLVFSGHKMLGPLGIGCLWARKEILQKMDPLLVGGGMIETVSRDKTSYAPLPDKFDPGTPNVAGAVGMAAAVSYLKKMGMEEIRQHEQELTAYGLEKFKKLEEKSLIELYGEREAEKRAGIITFNVNGVHGHDTAQILDREAGVAVRSGHHCNQLLMERLGVPATVRASFYLYNTKEEIDILVEGISRVRQVMKLG